MIPKSVSAVLILCALLFAAPVPVISQPDTCDSSTVSRPAAKPFPREVAVMWLNVIKDGQSELLPFTKRDLEDTQAITVDGYVNGVVMFSTARLRFTVDGEPMNLIRKNADGSYKVKYFGYFDRTEFWSKFMADELDRSALDEIPNFYSSFTKVPGDALSDAREVRITVAKNGIANHLTIRQNPAAKLDAGGPPAQGLVHDVYYHGNDEPQFEGAADAYQARVAAIQEGIRAVEAMVGRRIVDRVNLVDFEEQYNSFTCSGESDIWFYTRLFWEESVEELRTIAEHETLHLLSDRLDLPSNARMRDLYAEMMGFGPLSRERFAVMTTGRPAVSRRIVKRGPEASLLFEFINESNFIRGMKGGHAHDDLDEFCTSFLHTLMYVDRLEDNINSSIRHKNGNLTNLTTEERSRLLEDYVVVLSTMAGEIAAHFSEPLNAVLQTGLDTAEQAGLDADRTDFRFKAQL